MEQRSLGAFLRRLNSGLHLKRVTLILRALGEEHTRKAGMQEVRHMPLV